MCLHEEQQIIKGMKAGDEAAFRACVEEHKTHVLNICYYFVHNAHDADDLAQDVFIKVYRSINGFKENARLSSWIYRIAVNISLDFLRTRKRKKRFAYLTSLFQPDRDVKAALTSSDNPHSEMEQKERIELLNRAIASLPENQQTAITLNKYQGLSNQEIADILDTSVSAVDALIHRAKQNLRKKLCIYFEKQRKSGTNLSSKSEREKP